jgi:hypothetical protein
MTLQKQKPRTLTELYKDLLEVEKKQQAFAEQKEKFVKKFSTAQRKVEALQKDINNTTDPKQKQKLEQDIKDLSKIKDLVQNQLTDEAIKIAEIQNKNSLLKGQIKEAQVKLETHIEKATNSKDKELLKNAKGAQQEIDSYNKLVEKTGKKKQEEEKKKQELIDKVKLEEQKRQEEAMLKAEEKEKKRKEADRKAEDQKVLNAKKAKEKIQSDYVKERDNLFESAQNICSKTKKITPAIKEILEIDWTKKASEQKLQIAKSAVSVIKTGLNNAKSIKKIVTSAGYYLEEVKKIDIDDKAKTESSFFVKLLSDGKTQELLQNTLPQINKVAEEVAPILVNKTLDYLEKTGKKSEQKDAKTKAFAKRKLEILEQVAEYSKKNQSFPQELQQQFDAIKKEQESISKDNTSAKQSTIRQSLGRTISALKSRGFDDEHINSTFVPIMSSVIDNASKKPQEVTGAVKAVVDLGLASNSQEQAKAVTKLVLSELVRDTLKDHAVQNLATNQTGFITATIQEIVENNSTLQDRAKKIGVTGNSIRELTEMATGVATIGLKFGGKLLDGLSEERDEVQKVIETTINAGKKIAGIIDSNKEIGPEHIIQITNEAKVVANNALELMNQESVKGVIKELGADIAQDKELPAIIKQGVKTIATIAAPNVAKLGNFATVVDFAVDLGLNVTVAGLEGADEVNSLVKNTVLPVALNIASTVVKNRDKIDTLAKQIKNLSEEGKKQQIDNPVEKATNAINNGLEVASKITNFLNEGEIRESLTQNLSKLGKDLQSAKYVENLVTTVAQNILPTSEIIGDRETANQVIKDSAILAEKTAAAVLSEEKNIQVSLDAATAAVATAQSLLSNNQDAAQTAYNISKVVEGAVTLLTDKHVATIISNEIPGYIAQHGQTFIGAVTRQLSARQAKKTLLTTDEVLFEENGLIDFTVQDAHARMIVEQPSTQTQDEAQITASEETPDKKATSRDKAIEVATNVAKNVTNVLSVLQSEEGKESKEAIVSNLSKLGDQIREQGYIQKIVPKIIDPILQTDALKPLANSGINQNTINATSIVGEQIIGIALKNADVAIDIASNVANLAQNYAPVVTEKKPDNFNEREQALQGVTAVSHIVKSATTLLTNQEMSQVITNQIPGYIELHGANIVSAVVKLSESFTNKEKKAKVAIDNPSVTESLDQEIVLNTTARDLSAQNQEPVNIMEENEASILVAEGSDKVVDYIPNLSEERIAEEAKENKISPNKAKAVAVAKEVAQTAVNFLNVLQSEEGKESKEAIVGNLVKLGDQIKDQGYIQKIVPKIFDSLVSLEKKNSPDIPEESAIAAQKPSAISAAISAQKPSALDQQKDPMASEIATKITSKDVIATIKSIKDIQNIAQLVQDSSVVTEQIVSIALKESDAAINIATSLIALGQDAAQALAKVPDSSKIKDVESNDKRIISGNSEVIAAQSNILADNILTIAHDPAIKDLVTKELPEYIQGNKDTILAITKQLTGQYQAQIEAIGLSDEVIKQTAELSVKLLTDKNIAPIYELVGNIVNNAEMSNGGKQSDIALLIDHIYNAALNKDNKDARKEITQNAINKIGDIIFSTNTHDQVRSVVTQNIPRLLRENEKEIARLAEEFLERTAIGQKISSRISIDVERALKVAEKKSGTLLSLLENYHKKNYLGGVKNLIDLATSPKVIRFLGSTAARTIHMKIKGSHADRVNKRRPVKNERGR